MTAEAIVFVLVAIILCVAALLALLGTGQLALSGSDALRRDGLGRGQVAPEWSLPDVHGVQRKSPPDRPLQLIVFADHSLRSFPEVVAGLRALRGNGEELEVVILARGAAEQAGALLGEIGLGDIPVVCGSPALYARYNVRVMPFAIFVDEAGRVRASSLVNHDWQVATLRRVAGIPLEPGETATGGTAQGKTSAAPGAMAAV
jgi:hypothetical protein